MSPTHRKPLRSPRRPELEQPTGGIAARSSVETLVRSSSVRDRGFAAARRCLAVAAWMVAISQRAPEAVIQGLPGHFLFLPSRIVLPEMVIFSCEIKHLPISAIGRSVARKQLGTRERPLGPTRGNKIRAAQPKLWANLGKLTQSLPIGLSLIPRSWDRIREAAG